MRLPSPGWPLVIKNPLPAPCELRTSSSFHPPCLTFILDVGERHIRPSTATSYREPESLGGPTPGLLGSGAGYLLLPLQSRPQFLPSLGCTLTSTHGRVPVAGCRGLEPPFAQVLVSKVSIGLFSPSIPLFYKKGKWDPSTNCKVLCEPEGGFTALDGISREVCGRQNLLLWVWNLEDPGHTSVSYVAWDKPGPLSEPAFLFWKGKRERPHLASRINAKGPHDVWHPPAAQGCLKQEGIRALTDCSIFWG